MTNSPSFALSNVISVHNLSDAPARVKRQLDGLHSLSDLSVDTQPLAPISPLDDNQPIYTRFHQPRCGICRSHLRDRLEAEYMQSGKCAQSVVNHLRQVWDVSISWATVHQHMTAHCDMSKVGVPGLQTLAGRVESLMSWRYRERELSLLSLLDQIDRLMGIDTSRSVEQAIRVANTLRPLLKDLHDVQDERDRAALNSINILEVLMELHRRMVDDADKRAIITMSQELRRRLGTYSGA